jgi:sec-independent protein translocase protein TatA
MLLIFNDIAGSEILLILVFILIFFGSKSIPSLAKTLGKTIRQVKEASTEIQNEIKKSAGDIKGDLNLKNLIDDTAAEIKRPLDQYAQDIDHVMKYQPPNKTSHIPPTPVPEINSDKAENKELLDDNEAPEIKDSPKKD